MTPDSTSACSQAGCSASSAAVRLLHALPDHPHGVGIDPERADGLLEIVAEHEQQAQSVAGEEDPQASTTTSLVPPGRSRRATS